MSTLRPPLAFGSGEWQIRGWQHTLAKAVVYPILRTGIRTITGCACLIILGTGTLGAQTPVPAAKRELVGIVRDAKGAGVEGATVEVLGSTARTDPRGAFRLFTPELDTATIAIRRPGFSPIEALISARNRQWDTVVVELEQLSQQLPGVNIEEPRNQRAYAALRTFDERRARGNGLFLTREDIVARNSLRLSDVLQARRGIQLVRLGTGRMGVRFVNYAGSRGTACIPDLWIDGQRVRSMEIDDIGANNVEKMELYDSFAAVPAEFSHIGNALPCGTIVIWTRIPGKP
ncbi:MAG: carboxypeptidase-like regulatory domain-containing protein [Gemmatimonadota bacterium]|nr:carboxypeptidase-like regulatory domain-containing protein [Gemmatimonadota bacterium]